MHLPRGIRFTPYIAPLLLAACAGGGTGTPGATEGEPRPPSVTANTVYLGLHCGPRDVSPAVSWIENEADYTALNQRLDGHAMERVGAFPELDFERRGVVVVELGRRPTTGYSLSLKTPHVAIDADGTATLKVEVREPAAGMATAPMLTHPCLVASLPRGSHDRLRVVDGSGETLGVTRPNDD
jgi:hypothetical protein